VRNVESILLETTKPHFKFGSNVASSDGLDAPVVFIEDGKPGVIALP
jgi:hypothetical protein